MERDEILQEQLVIAKKASHQAIMAAVEAASNLQQEGTDALLDHFHLMTP